MTLVLSDFVFLLRFCVLAAPFQRTRNIRIRPYAFFDYTASRGSLFQVLFNNAASSFWKRHLPVSSDSKFSVWEKSNLKAPPPHTEEHEKVDVFGDTTSGRNESSPTQACDLLCAICLCYGTVWILPYSLLVPSYSFAQGLWSTHPLGLILIHGNHQ